MDTNSLIARLSQRKKRPGTWGYGVTTADVYLREFLRGAGGAKCPSRFLSGSNAEELLKDAARKLVNCDPNAEISEVKTAQESRLPKGIKAPKNTLMTFKNIITTPREDRDGDLLLTRGAIPDPKMPLLWQHLPVMPLGKMLAVDRHDDDMLRVWTALLDLNEATEDAAKLIEAEALRISHGFAPLEFEERLDKSGEFTGFTFHKYEIMEESLVSVPSNTDAVISTYSRNGLKSPLFRSWGRKLYEERPVQVPVKRNLVAPKHLPFADVSQPVQKRTTKYVGSNLQQSLREVLKCITDPQGETDQTVAARVREALEAVEQIEQSRRVGDRFREMTRE